MKSGFTSLANKIRIDFFSFSSRKLLKNYQMSDKIHSHICLMLSVDIKRSNMAGKKTIITRFNWA